MSPKKKQRKIKVINHYDTEDKLTGVCNDKNKHYETEYTNLHEDNEIHNIIKNQDDEYEMSVIIDIIKMQEKEELERLEKEKQEEIERQKLLDDNLMHRDYNIKEILRKIKFQVNNLSPFETSLIELLENTMNSQELIIMLNNKDFYENILCYLGLTNKRGSIRLNDDVKTFARHLFQLNINIS